MQAMAIVVLAVIGSILLVVMFVAPSGAALVLLAITPFEGLASFYLGMLSTLFTVVVLAIFLVRNSPATWVNIFLGSRLQIAVLILLFGLIISHVLAAQLVGVIPPMLSYGRKVALFLILGLFGWTFSSNRWVGTCMKALALTTVVFTVISMLDFYLGMRLFPGAIEAASLQGATGADTDMANVGRLRFRGLGLPINRTANWLLLPTFLALGWWMRGSFTALGRAVALGSLVLLLGGLLGTVSRAGILGFVVGAVVLLPLMLRRLGGQVLGFAAGAVVLTAGLYVLMLGANVGDLVSYRFAQDTAASAGDTRIEIWITGLSLFLGSPLYGVGSGIIQLVSASGHSTHNVYIQFLAESGLMGFLPFVAMLVFTVRGLTRKLGEDHEEIEYWRPFVFAAFVALLVHNAFNSYPWERYLWVCFGYAVAVEQAWKAERRARRQLLRDSSDQLQATSLQLASQSQ